MTDTIREFVRYEIPGYVCIAFSLLLLLPFMNFDWLQKNQIFFQWFGLIVAFVASGIPLGWFLFQVYRRFLHEYFGDKYVWRKPHKILKTWDKEGKTRRQFRMNLMDYALLKSRLRTIAGRYWSHASSRYITGLIVPVTSPLLAIVLYILVQFTPFSGAFHSYNITLNLLISATIWLAFFVILFFVVYWQTRKILVQIQNFIIFSLMENKEAITKLINNEFADEEWFFE